MFKSLGLNWWRKPSVPLSDEEIPKSFTVSGSGDLHLYKVSMDDTYADFVAVDYKKLSYAEAAALSKNKKQTSKVVQQKAKSSESPRAKDSPAYIDDEDDIIQEKFKTNNHLLKKVYKKSDRYPKRKVR